MNPSSSVKYWWTFSAGSQTDGCRPGRKAPEQMFAPGPGEDEARPVDHPVEHSGCEVLLAFVFFLAAGTF